MNNVINDSERDEENIAWHEQPSPAQCERQEEMTTHDFRKPPATTGMFRRIPFEKVNWPISCFLIGTFIISLTLVPAYVWHFGINWFQAALFFAMFCACGFSITLGYHRLF